MPTIFLNYFSLKKNYALDILSNLDVFLLINFFFFKKSLTTKISKKNSFSNFSLLSRSDFNLKIIVFF